MAESGRHWSQAITARFRQPDAVPATHGRLMLVLAALVLLLDLLLSLWVHNSIDKTIRDVLSGMSQSLLETQLSLVQQWRRGEMEMVRTWTAQPDLRQAVFTLEEMASANVPIGEIKASDSYRVFIEDLDKLTQEARHLGYALVGRDGQVLAASDPQRVGTYMSPLGVAAISQTTEGNTFTASMTFRELLYQSSPKALTDPVFPMVTPIMHQSRFRAALALELDPDDAFTELFSSAPFGRTVDSFAFNGEGLLISGSRRSQALKALGLLIHENRDSTVLNARLRDPGGSLLRGFKTDIPGDQWPLTHLAAMALSENRRQGINLNGYRDFRGVRVMGAWRWFPEINLGLGLEVDADEAYAIMLPIRIAEGVMLGSLSLAILSLIWFGYINHRISQRMQKYERLGQYQLDEKIGEGGMGEVYRASHAMLRRPTAVKRLRADADSELVQRFEREVQLTSQLTHPNTVEIYDFGRSGSGRFYYAMEYIQGITLAELIELSGPIPAERVLYLLEQICGSLREAHQRGLVHRDIKPLNIMLTIRGGLYDQVKVLDFGLVKDMGAPERSDLTRTQVLRGTPGYIAPERLSDPRCCDPRVDIYSVAAVAYNLLTAKELFSGSSDMEVMTKVIGEMPAPPSTRTDNPIPTGLEQLIMHCLSKEPEQRIADIAALLRRLKQIRSTASWSQARAQAWWQQHCPQMLPPETQNIPIADG